MKGCIYALTESRQRGRMPVQQAYRSSLLNRHRDFEVGFKLMVTPGQVMTAMDNVMLAAKLLDGDIVTQLINPAKSVIGTNAAEKIRAGMDPEAARRAAFSEAGLNPDVLVMAIGPQAQVFVADWISFYNALTWWYDQNKDWKSRLWGGLYTDASTLLSEVRDWRRKFEAIGGKLTSPEPRQSEGLPDPKALPWGPIITLGIILAVILVLPPMLSAFAARKSIGAI